MWCSAGRSPDLGCNRGLKLTGVTLAALGTARHRHLLSCLSLPSSLPPMHARSLLLALVGLFVASASTVQAFGAGPFPSFY